MWHQSGKMRKTVGAVSRRAAAACIALLLALPGSPLMANPIVDEGLERLAGTLGAVHYLRTLCRPEEGQLWRDKMVSLLGTGKLTPRTRDRLVAAFNAGYSRQQSAHTRCTASAANLGNTYAQQGAAQARQLADRLEAQPLS